MTREPSGALATIGGTVLGTDGAGAEHLIVKGGAARSATLAGGEGESSRPRVWMNGPEVFSFTIATVRNCLQELIAREEIRWEDVRHFLLHQASGFMLDKLRAQLGLTEQQCPIDLEDVRKHGERIAPDSHRPLETTRTFPIRRSHGPGGIRRGSVLGDDASGMAREWRERSERE